ncbi:hypothetical protein M433DRAFT_108421 [Acidomyces richmondensis BFW]|nr:MAG: hypothetical protein FE78DRAFT_39613 [Acidomyces sp. 'richmondensis']KYG45355.1 hypothetical protein M433DRAFT_108421 [Acidomyces richmondensis BFW]
MESRALQRMAPPGVTILVSFLAFSSQWLFIHIEPGPLRKGDTYLFNILVVSLLICYFRTCYTNPGKIPAHWQELVKANGNAQKVGQPIQKQRWCRKCEAYKPPRAHHCKTCKRCIMKMDHHCVWTANCISHLTLPHFVRFLFYAVAAMLYLECFLYTRCAVLWQKRSLPSYLGPNVYQLIHLFLLVLTNSLVLFALILLLGRTIWSLALNMTTIESWEVERHHAVLRRAHVLGGTVYAPDGTKVRLERQEFPWDVGIWTNLCQGMGTRNVLAWFWPFMKSPSIESGLAFEHNGIDDPSKPWPPPDPDRMARVPRAQSPSSGNGFTQPLDIESFRQRQAADLRRFEDADGEYVVRRRPFHERLEDIQRRGSLFQQYGEIQDDNEEALITDDEDNGDDDDGDDDGAVDQEILGQHGRDEDAGEEGWRNKEGERLADFGVDEVADFYDEDEVPLAELMQKKKGGL